MLILRLWPTRRRFDQQTRILDVPDVESNRIAEETCRWRIYTGWNVTLHSNDLSTRLFNRAYADVHFHRGNISIERSVDRIMIEKKKRQIESIVLLTAHVVSVVEYPPRKLIGLNVKWKAIRMSLANFVLLWVTVNHSLSLTTACSCLLWHEISYRYGVQARLHPARTCMQRYWAKSLTVNASSARWRIWLYTVVYDSSTQLWKLQ